MNYKSILAALALSVATLPTATFTTPALAADGEACSTMASSQVMTATALSST